MGLTPDLFDWADSRNAAPARKPIRPVRKPKPAPRISDAPGVVTLVPSSIKRKPRRGKAAEVVFLPITRRRDVIRKLAARLAAYGGSKQGRFFIRSELEKMAGRRIAKGIPAEVAEADADMLERAIHVAAVLLRHQSGDAA